MKIFVLDNYDSFVYNLVQYLAELGADVTVKRNDVVTPAEVVALQPRGIVLSPGPGRPENAGIMNELVREAQGRVPVLGVCLGHQSIAQVHGGTIGYAPVQMHGKTSMIEHNGSRLFRGIDSPFTATRYHSLIVESGTVSSDVKITARADDDVIMALEHSRLPLYGVQFHPESILTTHGKAILRNFLEML